MINKFFEWLTSKRSKQGINDLKKWKEFGGHLERPAPPVPMRVQK